MKGATTMNELKLEETRTVKVGSIYRIHASEAWQGIEEGIIKVVKIVAPADKDQDKDNTQLEMLDSCDSDEERAAYTDCNWIGYEHRDRNGFATNGSFYMMPDWLFAEHISCY